MRGRIPIPDEGVRHEAFVWMVSGLSGRTKGAVFAFSCCCFVASTRPRLVYCHRPRLDAGTKTTNAINKKPGGSHAQKANAADRGGRHVFGLREHRGQGGAETLNLSSSPERADVTIVDEAVQVVYRGSTPTVVNLEKKRGYFSGKDYIITIAKSGYWNQTILVKTRPNGWYLAGNLLFGGLIGYLIVDPLTGAMWTFDTTAINANLANDGVSHSGAINQNKNKQQKKPPKKHGDLIQLSSSR